jgi:hypothetical protein
MDKGRFRSTTPTAIGTVLASASEAKSLMPPSITGVRATRAAASPVPVSSYFGVIPRMNGTIIAETTKHTAMTR